MATNVTPKAQVDRLASIPIGMGKDGATLGKKITVFGSTGMVSNYVFNILGRQGAVLTAATRGDDMEWRPLKVLCQLGKFSPSYFDLRDVDSVKRAIEGSDVVINLAGKHYETKHYLPNLINFSFKDLHETGYQTLAKVSRECDVKHFVHLSSMTSNLPQEEIKSEWAKTKKRGEEIVKEEFPGACIVRSNVIYGDEDRFLTWYARQMAAYKSVPLFERGEAEILPVFVNDVARAISAIACDYSFCDTEFDLFGDTKFNQRQVAEYVSATIRKEIALLDLPTQVHKYFGKYHQLFPNPRYTEDIIKQLTTTQTTLNPNALTFKDLGIEPNEMESKGFSVLYRFITGGHYDDPKGKQVVHS